MIGTGNEKNRLRKLDATTIPEIMGRPVYLVKYNPSYIREILSVYGDFPEIRGVLDENERKQGSFDVDNISVEVYPLSKISEIPDSSAIIITDGYYMEYYDLLLKEPGVEGRFETIYFYANRDSSYYLSYREEYSGLPLENIIIFRSGPPVSSYVRGTDFYDNARALFEYMLSIHFNEKYKLVWLVKDPAEFVSYEEKYENVSFLPMSSSISDDETERREYYRNLCLAKYIFMTDAYGFCRYPREGQIRVQLWHGCGFKTRTTFARCEHRYEYNIVISPLYSQIHQRIYGLREDQILITGYPKEDLLFHPASDWRDKLKIRRASKYIFWLPTFRTPVSQLSDLDERAPGGETGLPIVPDNKAMEELNRLLADNDTLMIIKIHPVQDVSMLHIGEFSNIVSLENETIYDAGLMINEILGHADALISDYSSAAVDYLLLDRPIGFTLDDVEEYEQSRGFVFDNIRDYLPGVEIYGFEDFLQFVRDVITGNDTARDKRQRIRREMHAFSDDRSSQRLIDALNM